MNLKKLIKRRINKIKWSENKIKHQQVLDDLQQFLEDRGAELWTVEGDVFFITTKLDGNTYTTGHSELPK